MLGLFHPQDFERYIEILLKKPIQFNYWIGFFAMANKIIKCTVSNLYLRYISILCNVCTTKIDEFS